jgi:hypothetical protein
MFDQLLDFVKLSRLTVSTARRVLTAQITGAGDAGDDAAAETLSSVEVVQPLGLLAYPTLGATTEALIARIGDTAVALGLIDKGGAAQAAWLALAQTADGDAATRLGFEKPQVLPSTYVIGPDGKLRQTLLGPQTTATLGAAMGGS